ncbi:MAG: DUF1499 domain-containing protein [Desulfobacterales bacterium]|nr:DUF1499 domain-containing protein [Desulfobacterales bacterium]
MNIGLKCFATLAEADKCDYKNSTLKTLPDGSTIRNLLSKEAIPEKDVKLIFVNGQQAALDTVLHNGDQVGLALQLSAACEIHADGKRPLGMTDGKLPPCPRRPNCISSEDDAGSARIEPLAFTGTPGAARECLKRAIQGIGGAIEFESDGYIWAVFKTTVFRFIDDMEFRIDPRNRVVHLRQPFSGK